MTDKLILEDMKETLKKHLPEAMAGELKKYLELAEAEKKQKAILEVRLEDRDKKIAVLDRRLKEAQTLIGEHEYLDIRRKSLDDRTILVDKREREFELELLKKELAAERQIKAEVREVVRDVFHSPVYEKMTSKTIPVIDKTYVTDYRNGENHTVPSSEYTRHDPVIETETVTKR